MNDSIYNAFMSVLTQMSDEDLAKFGLRRDENVKVEKKAEAPDSLETKITKILTKIGVPSHIKGFQYVRTAIFFSVQDIQFLDSMTKVLYPTIAKTYNTTPSRVERAIRHSINAAWERGNCKFRDKIFENSIKKNLVTPTNSEFIATIVDRLRMNMIDV